MEENVIQFLNRYKNGERHFIEIAIENGNLQGADLEAVVFEKCFLSVDFRRANLRNSRFINSNIKGCDFRGANLTNAHFERLAVEATQFKDAQTAGLVFKNNYCYSSIVHQKEFEEYFKNA